MKKLIALLLALIMVLSFAACSKGEPAPDNSGNESSQNEESSSEGESESKSNEEKLDHIRGSVDGLTYTNTAAEITFAAPEGWVFFNDDEIAALYNLTSE